MRSLCHNDKIIAIIAMTVIAIIAMISLQTAEAKDIVLTAIGAISGFTVGQMLKGNVEEKE